MKGSPFTQKQARVLIAIPSGQFWHARFAMDFTQLLIYSMSNKVKGYEDVSVSIINTRGSMIWKNRENAANKAIQELYTHLLFIDTDMTFPPQILSKLLSWKKHIVAGNCVIKAPPYTPTARLDRDTPLYVGPESTGLQKVWTVGTGVMLIHTSVFAKIEKPFFPVTWNEEEQDFNGEDWSFVDKVRAQGVPIYVDQDISCGIGHLGELEHTHVMSLGARGNG